MSDFLSQIAAKELSSTRVIQPHLGSLYAPWPNSANFSPTILIPDSDRIALNGDELGPSEAVSDVSEIYSTPKPESEPISQIPNHLSQWRQNEQAISQSPINQRPEPLESHHALSAQLPLSSKVSVRAAIEKSISAEDHPAQDSLQPTLFSFSREPMQSESAMEQQFIKNQLIQSETPDDRTITTEKPAVSRGVPQRPQEMHRTPTSFSIKQNVNTGPPFAPAKGAVQRTIDTISQSVMISPYVSQNPQPVIADKAKEASGKESTPSIRVNIGRIEVRAVMPEKSISRSPRTRSTPLLSLQDYLKQRNGG